MKLVSYDGTTTYGGVSYMFVSYDGTATFTPIEERTCWRCGGEGKVKDEKCSICGGIGKLLIVK